MKYFTRSVSTPYILQLYRAISSCIATLMLLTPFLIAFVNTEKTILKDKDLMI